MFSGRGLLTFSTVPLQLIPSPTWFLEQLQVRTPGANMLQLALALQPPFRCSETPGETESGLG